MTSPDDRSIPGQRRADGSWPDGERDTTVLDRDGRHDRDGDGVDDRTPTIPNARHDRDGDGVDDRKQGRLAGMFGRRRNRDADGDGVPDRRERSRLDGHPDGHDGLHDGDGHRDGRHDGHHAGMYDHGDSAAATIPVATVPAAADRDHDGRPDAATAVEERERWRLGWNSGADLGLLVMRIVLGGVFMAHGAQKTFGWFGGSGLDGFAQQLSDMGFRQADALAAVTAFTELVGGALVVLGIFTPLAAAGLLGVAINAVWTKWNGGLFAQDGGFEFELTLAALAAGITLTGAGRAALDNGRVWFRHPVVTGWFCLAIGVGAALLVRFLFFEG